MPTKYISQGLPTFPPTGNPETDAALTQWLQIANDQMGRNQQEAERLPYIVSTFNNQSGPTGDTAVKRTLQFGGGEQVLVFGVVDLQVKGSATTGGSAIETGTIRLHVIYPNGVTSTISSATPQAGRLMVRVDHPLGSSFANTTVTIRGSIPFVWPVEARFQSGGRHTFALVTGGDGQVEGAQMTIQVF